jgi:WD40 repeat protein
VLSTAKDVQRFIQLFAGMILHSTPHLYVSALPFSPIKSTIATKFTARFPNTLRLIDGQLMNWTAIQTVISGHTREVWSVSFSPDGTRIVSGSSDSTVRVWDAATGLPLGEPFQGHTSEV